MTVGSLLVELRRVGDLPLESGETMPSRAYTSPELYELELDRIFRREWLCVARADEITGPGDYLAVDLPGLPLVITRDERGELHALSRICRHRFMDVLPPELAARKGNLPRLTCPYHAWTYRLNGQCAGQLAAAPLMRKVNFDYSEHWLPGYRVEVWNGFVFVNLDPNAEPLAPGLEELERRIAPYDLARWSTVATLSWPDVRGNWKVAVENGSESYHHIGAHARTLQPILPGQATEIHDCDGKWFTFFNPVAPGMADEYRDGYPLLPTPIPACPGLTVKELSGLYIVGVFPTFFLALTPTFAVWFRWTPTGPRSHNADLTVLTYPGAPEQPGYPEALADQVHGLKLIQDEDLVMITGVQRGHESAPTDGGRFSDLERPIWQFQRFLADRLAVAG